MKYNAYAKVNLILKVVDKYDSGYHRLQMLNAKIDLHDEIDIEKNNLCEDRLFFLNSNLDSAKDNLMLRVLRKLKGHYNIEDNFDIYIRKEIPIGAGLGGGSCDAGCIINAILSLYNIKEDLDVLSKMFSSDGADIPYALTNKMAFVDGIGDEVFEIDYIYDKDFVIVNPNIFISTKDIFTNNKKFTNALTKESIINDVKINGYNVFCNDLEEACFSVNNDLKKFKDELMKIGYASMSGSGSTFMVFGEDVDYIYKECKNKFPTYFVKKVKVIKE